MDEYPKIVHLKDETNVTLRVMQAEDIDNLIEFFQNVAEEDRLYLRMDTKNPKNVKRRFEKINYDAMLPVLAMLESEIIGIATLFRADFGWMKNLGEIRVVIAQKYQRKGLATILIRELFFQALKKKFYKLQAEIMITQLSAMAAFEKLGFKKEATLKKHVTDIKGIRRDLVIMTLDVEELWYLMEDFIKTPDFRIH